MILDDLWEDEYHPELFAKTGPDILDAPDLDYVEPSRFRSVALKVRRAVTKVLDRSVRDVIGWSRQQSAHPTQSWKGLCQSHVRHAYGVPAWAPSAIEAWNRIPEKHKHRTSNPNNAPRGAAIYYSGGKYGHVVIAIGVRTHDKCLSNDYVRPGRIDVAPRSFPRWGIKCEGWSFWTPYGSLDPKR